VRFGAIQAQAKGEANIHKTTMVALRISLAASLLFAVTLIASASWIAESIFHKPELTSLIAGLSLCIPFMSVQALLLAATLALKTVKYSVLVRVAQPFAALVLAIALLALGGGMQAVAFAMVGSYIIGAGLAICFYRRVVPRKEKDARSLPVGQMLKFSLPLSLSQWLNFANQRTEVFFLGLLPRAVDVGIYNIAWRIAGLETMFSESLGQIFAPFGSELSHRRQIKQLNDMYKATTKWAFAGALMLFAIFALFPQTILGIFDPSFTSAGWVLIALGFAQLINSVTGPCGVLLVMSGRSDLNLLNTIILLITSIALDWLLIPTHGLAGAAVAGAATIILVNLLRVIEVWLTLKVHPFKWSMMGPLVAAIAGWVFVYVLRAIVSSQSIMMDITYAVLLVAVYLTIIYFFKLDDDDKLVLKAMRQKMVTVLELARFSP
jgi:O-antigen/teichoic acid export membrane protein